MPEQEHRIGEISALREEVAQLRHAVVSHAVIDQAIGVVLAYGGLRSDAGWEVLREVSQHTNTKLREVAEYLVQWPHCAWLPPEIHRGLDAALQRRGSLGGACGVDEAGRDVSFGIRETGLSLPPRRGAGGSRRSRERR
ncbi:ANTAR domain-containing protein [Streptomyces lichenis]|uniref:ANTAR domain-containing protein n=1 Tax=Streptomyces lichenis TaxID=2306967 RepID=A0ABT0I9S4_9ACTN|nr:ANTAR domain-containing protein [Streptomyces lichenis]MCK8678082.1 ANTAR domain-containing protein [Streptomyces lichenis]